MKNGLQLWVQKVTWAGTQCSEFSPQARLILCQYMDNFAALVLNCFYILNILIRIAWTSLFHCSPSLSVGDEPVLIDSLQDLTVVASDTAVFSCHLKLGEPAADIRWCVKGKPLTAGDKYKMSYSDTTATLEVVNTEATDAAEYSIKAVNKVASVTSHASLTVHSKSASSSSPLYVHRVQYNLPNTKV